MFCPDPWFSLCILETYKLFSNKGNILGCSNVFESTSSIDFYKRKQEYSDKDYQYGD